MPTDREFDKPLAVFFLLGYAIAWSCIPLLAWIASTSGLESWIALSAMAERWDYQDTALTAPTWLLYLITRIQDFSFSIAGVAMILYLQGWQGIVELKNRLLAWRIGWIWLFVALLPLVFYFIAMVLAGGLKSFTISSDNLYDIFLSLESGMLITLLLRGPMGEELGLRGFALPRLLHRYSAFKASCIIGVLWALWHLPVLMDKNAVSIVVFLLLAFVLSFIFTWIYIGSNGSLVPVLLFHTTQNNEETFELLFPAILDTDWELPSSLMLLMLGIVAVVVLYRRKMRTPPGALHPSPTVSVVQ